MISLTLLSFIYLSPFINIKKNHEQRGENHSKVLPLVAMYESQVIPKGIKTNYFASTKV